MLAFAIGMAMSDTEWTWRVAVGAFVSFAVTAAANLHNAYSDIDEDSRNLPGRLALVDAVGVRTLRTLTFGTLALVFLACAALNIAAGALVLVGGLLLLSYSAPPVRAKARPFLGLVVFSLIVVVPYFAGALVRNEWSQVAHVGVTQIAVGIYLLAWFMAKGLVKNVPDFDGDLAAGLRTSATVMPDRSTAAHVAATATIAVYAAYPIVVMAVSAPAVMLIAGVWLLPAIASMIRLTRARDAAASNRALKHDMTISVGFLATILLSTSPTPGPIAYTVISLGIFLVAELVRADSRAPEHLDHVTTSSVHR